MDIMENVDMPSTPSEMYREIHKSMNYHDVSDSVRGMIAHIENSDFDVLNNFDGCTLVSDNSPRVNIACFIHDYLFTTGFNLYQANKIFLKVMKEIHTGEITAHIRWVGVTIATVGYFYWRNTIRQRSFKSIELPKVFKKYLK